jgi:hypothetical protein
VKEQESKRHIERKHIKDLNLCEQCDKNFEERNKVTNHIHREHEEKEFEKGNNNLVNDKEIEKKVIEANK